MDTKKNLQKKEVILKEIDTIKNQLIEFKKSIIMQRNEDFYLKKEFDEWDTLSGEALKNFES